MFTWGTASWVFHPPDHQATVRMVNRLMISIRPYRATLPTTAIRWTRTALSAFLLLTCTFAAADRATVVERVRAELATLLKKEPASLPINKPVVELGADDLDVVEWAMAVEKAFGVPIPDDRFFDPKSKTTRKSFSIDTMATLVVDGLQKKSGKTK